MGKMTNDPAGHYAALEVDPAAPPEAIAAAYRRKARVLHPDVMGTGDAAAFMRIKLAYDVLGDAASPRRLRPLGCSPRIVAETTSLEPAPRGPRLSDLPVALWAGLGGVFCLAAIMAMVQFSRSLAASAGADHPAFRAPGRGRPNRGPRLQP